MNTAARLLALSLLVPYVAAAAAISVTGAWVRATQPGAVNAAAYFEIANSGPDDRLVGATSTAATELQLHANVEQHGMQHMHPLAEIPIPSGANVLLAPGGTHVMLIGITQPLRPGDEVVVTLHFALAGDVVVTLPVRDGRLH